MNKLALLIIALIFLSYISFIPLKLNVIFDSLPELPKNSIDLGAIQDDAKINLIIGLKMQNQEFLEELITSGKISIPVPNEIIEKFLPPYEAYKKVIEFIEKAQPLKIITYKDRLLISFEANASNIERLLKIRIFQAYYNGSIYYYSTPPQLNSDIAQYIQGFVGLTNYTHYKSISSLIQSVALTPNAIRSIYRIDKLINSGYNGTGQTIVIASVGTFRQSDVDQFFKNFDLPTGNIEIHQVQGTLLAIDSETTIDIEWARAIAPAAKIMLATIQDSSYDSFTQLFNYIVDNDLGNIVSTSWVIEENLLSKDEIDIQHSIFLLGLAKGINFFFPSGDWGSSNSPRFTLTKNPINNTISYFPASDPLVTSVGGTTLKNSFNGYIEEAWGGIQNNGTYGSGGGFSKFFYRPFYQPKSIGNMRGYPDVSLNAGSDSPYVIYYNGRFGAGYGTSIATPIWAAITAILSQMSNGNIGFLNYRLYSIYNTTKYDELFNDITQGTNGYYNATKGWDPVTGLGTPKTDLLLNYLANNLKSIYILPISDSPMKIMINNTLSNIPIIINFTNQITLNIKINDTIYLNKTTRYVYNSTTGIINSTNTEFSLTVNKTGNLIISFTKQYLINATSNMGYVLGSGWHNEGDYVTLRAINPFSIFFAFKGWIGDINSDSQVLVLKVDRSYNLVAIWQFSIVSTVFFLTVIAVLILSIIIIFRQSRRMMKKTESINTDSTGQANIA